MSGVVGDELDDLALGVGLVAPTAAAGVAAAATAAVRRAAAAAGAATLPEPPCTDDGLSMFSPWILAMSLE